MRPRTPITRLSVAVSVLLGTVGSVGVARAHVEYVTPGGAGDAAVFLRRTFSDPFALVLFVAGAVGIAAAIGSYLRFRPLARDVATLRVSLSKYRDLLPWLLRLSVGLPLVGAGFSGYFFTPASTLRLDPTVVRLFGVGVGFLLLFGLATRFVAAVALASYLVGLALEPALALAFEYAPGLLAVALVGGGRPSADDVIATLAADDRTAYSRIDPFYRAAVVPFRRVVEPSRRYVPTIVRVGLGLSFFYLGLTQKLLSPGDALAVVDKYQLTSVVPVSPALWVAGAGLVEMFVGVALVFGLLTRAFAGVAFVLLTTTLFGLPDDPVIAHVSLFGLVSLLLVTGSGPLGLDRRLAEPVTGDAERPVIGD